MSATDVQLRFAAEFALFLVSLAGVGFAFLRADLLVDRRATRYGVAAGFAALAAAAFCSGALVVDDPTSGLVVGLRSAGIVLLAVTARWWHTRRACRWLLLIGVLALAGAEAGIAADDASTAVDVARGAGALVIGAALVVASTRAISARIAASAAAILFVVIAVLAVALSAVVTDNVEDEAIRRYGARAQTEADETRLQSVSVLGSTQVLASALASTQQAQIQSALATITDPALPPEQVVGAAAVVAESIRGFVDDFVSSDPRLGSTVVLRSDGRIVASVPPPRWFTHCGARSCLRHGARRLRGHPASAREPGVGAVGRRHRRRAPGLGCSAAEPRDPRVPRRRRPHEPAR